MAGDFRPSGISREVTKFFCSYPLQALFVLPKTYYIGGHKEGSLLEGNTTMAKAKKSVRKEKAFPKRLYVKRKYDDEYFVADPNAVFLVDMGEKVTIGVYELVETHVAEGIVSIKGQAKP